MPVGQEYNSDVVSRGNKAPAATKIDRYSLNPSYYTSNALCSSVSFLVSVVQYFVPSYPCLPTRQVRGSFYQITISDYLLSLLSMKITEVIQTLEAFAPLPYQENYDNAGLLTGSSSWECTGILCTLDA